MKTEVELKQVTQETEKSDLFSESHNLSIKNDGSSQNDREHAEWLAKNFKEVDWLIPAYLPLGFLSKLAYAIKITDSEEKSQIMPSILKEVYDPIYLATIFLERYSKIIHIRDFKQIIEESIKAYFSGYKCISITALLSVIEGIVRKIAIKGNRKIEYGTKKIISEFQAFVEREISSPYCYGERLVMLEVFRDFVRDRLFKNTNDYDGQNELNRHGILHGLYSNYGKDINFFRLITLLDLLCFSIGLIEGGVSCFTPEPTTESLKLAEHYVLLKSLVGSYDSGNA